MKPNTPDLARQIVIIDYGGQLTLPIATRLRESAGVCSVVLTPKKAEAWIKERKPRGIILSGGHKSVNGDGAPTIPPAALKARVPILGLCYGEQLLAKHFGGKVEALPDNKQYGTGVPVEISPDPLFGSLHRNQIVTMSHGDTVTKLPRGARCIVRCRTTNSIAGFSNHKRKIWGLQFHPESHQTNHGTQMLVNFAYDICECNQDWKPSKLAADIEREIKTLVGKDKAIMGFSGGVDSCTTAYMAAKVLGKNLLCVIIDFGQFREGELEEAKLHAEIIGARTIVVPARQRLQKALRGTTNGKRLRKVFSKLYIKIFEEVAKRFGAKVLIQGSLATDFIESGSAGKADQIKKHHNIGNKSWLRQIHPLRTLFKYEVRNLCKQLGLPASIHERMPVPGPDLYLRLLGAPATPWRRALVREADAKVDAILRRHNLRKEIDQWGVHLIFVETTGVNGDARSSGYIAIVRTIKSADYMTAEGYHLSATVKKEIEADLTKNPKITHVAFDTTPKPPATIELR